MSNTTAPKLSITADGNLVGGHFCKCGCGEVITTKGLYRPGHDARHVSELLISLRQDANDEGSKKIKIATARLAAKELPSAALQAKLMRAVENANTPRVRKPKAELVYVDGNPEPVEDTDTVLGYTESVTKIGRWEYPTRTYTDGSVERNTKRDGSGEWVAA